MCIDCVYFSAAVRTGPGIDLTSFQTPYYLFSALMLVWLNKHLSGVVAKTEDLKIQHCMPGQVDELMQQKLENLILAVDGEKSGKQKKGRKSEKVRAASCENSG